MNDIIFHNCLIFSCSRTGSFVKKTVKMYLAKVLENTKPINIMQLIEEIPMPGRIHREKMAA